MTTRYFIFNEDGSFEEGDESLLGLGDGRPIALVDEHDDGGGFSIEVDQYYYRDGFLQLEITQPLPRALRTFWALLQADAEQELEEERI